MFVLCNLGEGYYLGQKRNEVFREYNSILNVEDFKKIDGWINIDHER